jgi:hemerythrin superfamily protein
MDAVELLVSQHRTMEALAKQVLAAEDDEERLSLFRRAGDELTTHIASEEEVFYPAVKAARTEDILLESLEEHLSLKRLLADLLALEPSDQTFEAKFKVLREQMEHHHKEEEENLFPKVLRLLAPADRDTLGDEMLDLQERLANEGQPRRAVLDQTDQAARL